MNQSGRSSFNSKTLKYPGYFEGLLEQLDWILESIMPWPLGIVAFKVTKPFCMEFKIFVYQILLSTKEYSYGVPMSWIKESVIHSITKKSTYVLPLVMDSSYLLSAKYEADQIFLSLLTFQASISFLPDYCKPHNPCPISEIQLLAWHGI